MRDVAPRLILIFIFLMLSFLVKAQEETKLLIEGPESVIHIGDVERFNLTLWPIDDLKEINIKSLEGRRIGESLAVISVDRPAVSSNNEQAIETKMTAVFVSSDELPESLSLGNKQVELLKRSIETTGEVDSIKELNIFARDEASSRTWLWLVMAMIVLAAVTLSFLVLKKSKKLRRLKEKRENEDFWKTKLKAAQSREEIEEVYAKRKKWIEALSPPSAALAKFCDQIEEVQYKRQWTEDEFREVTQGLNELRRRTLT